MTRIGRPFGMGKEHHRIWTKHNINDIIGIYGIVLLVIAVKVKSTSSILLKKMPRFNLWKKYVNNLYLVYIKRRFIWISCQVLVVGTRAWLCQYMIYDPRKTQMHLSFLVICLSFALSFSLFILPFPLFKSLSLFMHCLSLSLLFYI